MDINDAYTKDEANDICEHYTYLIGTSYIEELKTKGIIECVTIAPYDDLNKWIFFQSYLENRDPVKAIKYYQVPFFDVILIVLPDNGPRFFKSIRNYQVYRGEAAPVNQHTIAMR